VVGILTSSLKDGNLMNPNSRALTPIRLRAIANRPRLVSGYNDAFPGDYCYSSARVDREAVVVSEVSAVIGSVMSTDPLLDKRLITNLRIALRDADRESLERPYCLGCGSHTDDNPHKADCLIYNTDGSAK
jgi:hypothetical protein